MTRDVHRPLAVLLLVVVAGCVGFLPGVDGGSDDAEPDLNLSPADRPPGVASNGTLEDPEGLVDAHRTALFEQGFAVRYVANRSIRVFGDATEAEYGLDDRPEYVAVGRVRATPEAATFLTGRNLTNGETVVRWTNGSVGVERVVAPDGTVEYAPLNADGGPYLAASFFGSNLEYVVARLDWRVAAVRAETLVLTGDDYVRVGRAERRSNDRFAATGRMVVTRDGVIRSLSVTLNRTVVLDEEPIGRLRESVDYDLQRVGNVSVPPPEWVGEARTATEEE